MQNSARSMSESLANFHCKAEGVFEPLFIANISPNEFAMGSHGAPKALSKLASFVWKIDIFAIPGFRERL